MLKLCSGKSSRCSGLQTKAELAKEKNKIEFLGILFDFVNRQQ
jgi:hypothetical protein